MKRNEYWQMRRCVWIFRLNWKAREKAAIKALNDSAPKLYQEKILAFDGRQIRQQKQKISIGKMWARYSLTISRVQKILKMMILPSAIFPLRTVTLKAPERYEREPWYDQRRTESFSGKVSNQVGLEFKKRTNRLNAYYEAMQNNSGAFQKE